MKELIIGLCAVGLLATSSIVRAQDDDHKQGGATSGIENLQVDAVFIATSNAPVGSVATLKIRDKNRLGTSDTQIKIKTLGLPDGTYNVSATLKSDGSLVALGQITIGTGNGGGGGDNSGGDNSDPPIFDSGGDDPPVDNGDEAVIQSVRAPVKKPKVNVTESEVDLPSDVSSMDLATVTIADSTDVPLFDVDVVTAPGKSLAVFSGRVSVVSDDPKVKGSAVLSTKAQKGKQRAAFVMGVQKLPKNTILHVVVNGQDTGATVTTNRAGSVVVKKLTGVDLTNLQSVALTDDSGTTLAQVVF